jgi:vitamin B12 transporter
MQKIFNRFLIALYFSIFSFELFAQDKTIELDPVTISASLSPQQISKTGRNITIITQETIQKLPANSIDEIIRYLPGIEVQSRGPMGAQSNITIRGGTFQQVLIILDGIRLNDPLTGHFNSYIPITPDEIERIEILKGPAAVLYGTEAVGGVVHIISKTFSQKNKKEGYRLVGQVIGGDYGLMNGQGSASFQKNKTSASSSFISNNADGQTLRGAKGFFNLNTLTASIKQSISKSWNIAYRFGLDDRNFNAQNFYTTLPIDTATEKVKSQWHQFKAQYEKKQHLLIIDMGSKQLRDEFRLNNKFSANINESTLEQAQLTYQFRFTGSTNITAGSQYIRRSINSNDRGNHILQNASGFIMFNAYIANNILLSPGFRAEWNERRGWEMLPQANLSYAYKKFNFRGNIGRTARDADFTERFNNYQKSRVISGRIGNPNLTAETAESYEVGADYIASKNLKFSATVFERNHTNLIDWTGTPYTNMPRKINLVDTGKYQLASNIASVITKGIELDVQYLRSFGKHDLETTIGAIWMESSSSNKTPSLYVSNHARLLVNLRITYRHQWLGLTINGLYKERNEQSAKDMIPLSPSYMLFNARANVYLMKNKLTLFVQADNVFDQNYSDILGSVMPNRWLMGGVKLMID